MGKTGERPLPDFWGKAKRPLRQSGKPTSAKPMRVRQRVKNR
tara:strand:+ start:420 stop:545 length:126 start_codon:yes stop_codon:yes gene_type:complete